MNPQYIANQIFKIANESPARAAEALRRAADNLDICQSGEEFTPELEASTRAALWAFAHDPANQTYLDVAEVREGLP